MSSLRGDDTFHGLTPERPKRTLAAGKQLLRSGYPDWLLLRRGDRWTEPLGQWFAGGRSRTEPQVVASYGDGFARPLIEAPGDCLTSGAWAGSPARIEHVAFVGLHLRARRAPASDDTPYGIVWRLPGEDLLVEDCFVEGFFQNVVFEPLGGRFRDVRVRRSIISDAYTTGPGHAQGLYAYAIDGLLIEDNVFDQNGWRGDLIGAEPTVFRHNVYVQTGNSGVRAVGNVFADAGSHGLQMRSGGEVTDNLFLRNPIALMLGNKDGEPTEPFTATDNVILDGVDIGPDAPRGWGIEVASSTRGRIAHNVVANMRRGTFPLALNVYSDRSHPGGVHDLAIEDNVFWDWGPILMQGHPPLVSGVSFERNVVRDDGGSSCLIEWADAGGHPDGGASSNMLQLAGKSPDTWLRIGGAEIDRSAWSSWFGAGTFRSRVPNLLDPSRSEWGYLAEIDPTVGAYDGERAFMEALRGQSRSRWRPELAVPRVNAWIRAGFEPVSRRSS